MSHAENLLDTLSGTERRVAYDIAARQEFGRRKYGRTVEENPAELGAWMQHAYEEALDMAIYLKRAMEDLKRMSASDAEDERTEVRAPVGAPIESQVRKYKMGASA